MRALESNQGTALPLNTVLHLHKHNTRGWHLDHEQMSSSLRPSKAEMASPQFPEHNAPFNCIMDLPEHVLNKIFVHLDEYSLCTAAQTCGLFLRLAGNADLWMHQGIILPEDKLMMASRLCLSRALHLPPQIFKVQYDISRSAKFPVAVPFSNLKGILGHLRLDDVLATACSGIAEQIKCAQRASQDAAQDSTPDPPAALFVLVRPERASVRFELKQRTAFIAILQGFEELGWPASFADPARLVGLGSKNSARSLVLLDRHLYGSFREQMGGNPLYSTVERVLRSAAPHYWSLRKGALQCLEAAHQQGQQPSVLQDWLGPSQVLGSYATRSDLELVLRLRRFFPDKIQGPDEERGLWFALHRPFFTTLQDAAHILETQCSSMTSKVLPYVAEIRQNGLMELAECLRQGRVLESSNLGHTGMVEQGTDAVGGSELRGCDDQIGRVLSSSDPALVARLRLRARLHLEVLRVMHWCFFMLGTER